MENIKYTKDGKKVVVLGELNSNESIVQEIHVSGDKEFPSGENFVVKSLHDEPCETWQDKKIRQTEEGFERSMRDMRVRFDRAHADLRISTEKAKLKSSALLAFNEQANSTHVETLKSFLSGEITHLAFPSSYEARIAEFDEEIYIKDRHGEDARMEDIKLVSLFGRSSGDLAFRANQYYDGSGSWKEIIPCRSYDEALAAMQNAFDSLAERFMCGKQASISLDRWGLIEGLKIPQEVSVKASLKKAESIKARIGNTSDLLKKLNEELSSLGLDA